MQGKKKGVASTLFKSLGLAGLLSCNLENGFDAQEGNIIQRGRNIMCTGSVFSQLKSGTRFRAVSCAP